MEERYGQSLFDRSGPLLVPTEAGKIVLLNAESILRIEKELETKMKEAGGKACLSVCCTPTFGMVYLPNVLNQFVMQNDQCMDFKFTFATPDQAIKGLHDNEYDIVVIEHCEGLDLSPFQTYRLPDDELVFISSRQLALPVPEVPLDLLFQHRLITRKEGCSSNQLLRMNLAAFGREIGDFRSTVIYDDLRITIQTIMDGGGIAFVSGKLVSKLAAGGMVHEHRVDGFRHTRMRTVVMKANGHMARLQQSFLDSILASF
jgi:DNA-binding transcriptional LysR family regulator